MMKPKPTIGEEAETLEQTENFGNEQKKANKLLFRRFGT